MELPDDVLEDLLHRAHVGQYINSVAHDLNNLVGASMAYAELIDMDTHDPEVKRMVGEIISAAEKSAALLNAITAIARPIQIDSETASPVKDLFDALELLYIYDCKLSQIEMTFTANDAVGLMSMEQHMAQRIIMRLIDNAMESVVNAETKRVMTNAELQPEHLCITVQDSGDGVSENIAATMFDPRVTSKEGHVGMGLTIARQLAEQCGARLDYNYDTGFVLSI